MGDVTVEIDQRQLRNHSGEAMRRVEGRETFLVTRNGDSLAELRPVALDVFSSLGGPTP